MKWYMPLLMFLAGVVGVRCGDGDNRQPVAGEKCGDIEFACEDANIYNIIQCDKASDRYVVNNCRYEVGIWDGCTGGVCDPKKGCVEGNLLDGTELSPAPHIYCVNGSGKYVTDWPGEPCDQSFSRCMAQLEDSYYHVVCNLTTGKYEVTACSGKTPGYLSTRCQDPENLCDGQVASE